MITLRSLAAAAVAGGLLIAPAFAHGYKAGSLVIGHPWARATPAGAPVAGGFLTVENTGTEPDKLVSVSSEIAGRSEVHEMSTKDGMMTMRPVAGGVEIPAGQKVELKPGGYHIMFMQLKGGLKEGESVKGVLTFEKAGAVPVEFKVQSVGAKTGGEMPHMTH